MYGTGNGYLFARLYLFVVYNNNIYTHSNKKVQWYKYNLPLLLRLQGGPQSINIFEQHDKVVVVEAILDQQHQASYHCIDPVGIFLPPVVHDEQTPQHPDRDRTIVLLR